MPTLTFITGNPGKLAQLNACLPFVAEHRKIDLPEIQSLDLKEAVTYKVREAYEVIKSPVLVEDVSLVIVGMNGLPGPFIKFFLESIGTAGLCQLAATYGTRAEATVAYAYYDGREVSTFVGKQAGTIADVPRGTGGFGFDPAFIPDGSDLTWAEMVAAGQDTAGMRRRALAEFTAFLGTRES